jgi:hypothetical protein
VSECARASAFSCMPACFSCVQLQSHGRANGGAGVRPAVVSADHELPQEPLPRGIVYALDVLRVRGTCALADSHRSLDIAHGRGLSASTAIRTANTGLATDAVHHVRHNRRHRTRQSICEPAAISFGMAQALCDLYHLQFPDDPFECPLCKRKLTLRQARGSDVVAGDSSSCLVVARCFSAFRWTPSSVCGCFASLPTGLHRQVCQESRRRHRPVAVRPPTGVLALCTRVVVSRRLSSSVHPLLRVGSVVTACCCRHPCVRPHANFPRRYSDGVFTLELHSEDKSWCIEVRTGTTQPPLTPTLHSLHCTYGWM